MIPILEFDKVSVDYRLARSVRGMRSVRVVRDVSFSIGQEETFALVGESGSGKSTLARAALRLLPASTGRVLLDGEDIARLRGPALRSMRRRVMMVFQDPYSSLDPSMTIGDSIAEPLRVHRVVTPGDARRRVGELLETVGLSASYATRYPHEFSGGQRQRIAIARALGSEPDLLVCDEAVSALDVSTQNQIVTLIARLRDRMGMACLFITHDLALVRHVADRVGVMYLGPVVEAAATEDLFTHPGHPYTTALLSAIPVANPILQRERVRLRIAGEIPDPANPPAGCGFNTRCPFAEEVCFTDRSELGVDGVACHFPGIARDSLPTAVPTALPSDPLPSDPLPSDPLPSDQVTKKETQ